MWVPSSCGLVSAVCRMCTISLAHQMRRELWFSQRGRTCQRERERGRKIEKKSTSQPYLFCWAFSQSGLAVPEPLEDDFLTPVSSPAEQVPLACSMIAFLLQHTRKTNTILLKRTDLTLLQQLNHTTDKILHNAQN